MIEHDGEARDQRGPGPRTGARSVPTKGRPQGLSGVEGTLSGKVVWALFRLPQPAAGGISA
ncbi:hypothetical protein ACWELV_50170, partial [Streptomyces mirabilis]